MMIFRIAIVCILLTGCTHNETPVADGSLCYNNDGDYFVLKYSGGGRYKAHRVDTTLLQERLDE